MGGVDSKLSQRPAGNTSVRKRMIGKHSAIGSIRKPNRSKLDSFNFKYTLHCASQTLVSETAGLVIREELATRRSDGKIVKVQIIPRSGSSSKASQEVERMHKKIALLQQLNRQYIISLEEFFEESQCFVCVYQYHQDDDLLQFLVREEASLLRSEFNELSLREDIARGLFNAVKHCHDNNIVHRDIQPANIRISTAKAADGEHQPTVRLSGFQYAASVASSLPSQQQQQLLTGFVGTPAYMAPEVLKSFPHDKAADMWSLGVVLYLLLGGNSPFKESAQQQKSSLRKILHGTIPFKGVYWANVSVEGKDLIKQLLQVDAKHRIDIEDALLHPWFSTPPSVLRANNLSATLDRIAKFQSRQLLYDAMANLNTPRRIQAHLETCKTYVDMIIDQESRSNAINSNGIVLKRNPSISSDASTLSTLSSASKTRFRVNRSHTVDSSAIKATTAVHNNDDVASVATSTAQLVKMRSDRIPRAVEEVVLVYSRDPHSSMTIATYLNGTSNSSSSKNAVIDCSKGKKKSPSIPVQQQQKQQEHKLAEVVKVRAMAGRGSQQLKQFAALQRNQSRINYDDLRTQKHSRRHAFQSATLRSSSHEDLCKIED